MKQMFLFIAVVIAIAFAGCNKNDDDFSDNRQPVSELKHSSTPIPFNGSFEGLCSTVQGSCSPGWIGRHFEGKGNATHMGKCTAVLEYCMKLEYPSIDPTYDGIFNGPGYLTSANGDMVTCSFAGNITFVFDDENNIIGGNILAEGVVYGGTGRFEGAFGYIYGTGYMDFTESMNVNIPTTFEFTGFLLYGAEYFDMTMAGTQTATGACPGGGNSYTQTGTGTGTIGDITSDMEYCTNTELLPTPTPYPFPLPPGTPIGGTNSGTGTMIQVADPDNTLSSSYNMFYRFTFIPGTPPTIINDSYGFGTITGGTGDYEGATGKFVMVGTQSFLYPNPSGAISTVRCIGYLDY